jgi:hypothetical protein
MKQHAGIDVQALYPAGQPPKAENWTLDTFLKAAEACHKAGFPFGIGLGTTTDSVDTIGAIFQSFRRDARRCQRQDHGQERRRAGGTRLLHEACQVLPARCPGVGRRHQQQVAGGRQRRADHEPAQRLGRRQAGCAAGCRAAVDARHAVGARRGRFAPFASYFWGVWSFGKNKSAAKSLLVHLSQPEAIEKLVVGSQGFDLPPFANMTTLKVWAEEGPPKGTLYHYPNPYNHQILSIAAAPSPPKIAQQIYAQGLMTKMTVRHMQGEPMEKTLAWAETQLEGFMRS